MLFFGLKRTLSACDVNTAVKSVVRAKVAD